MDRAGLMDWRAQFDMFTPHGMCLLWRPELMSLHIISDALIALAYFTIPLSILRFVRGRDDLNGGHLRLAFLFAAFITLCGITHVVSIVVLWLPIYIVEGWLKAVTAAVSIATALLLVALLPQALKLPSVTAMQREIAARRKTESDLRAAQHDLHQIIVLLRTVIEVVPGLIYAKDRTGRILLANKATLDLIGKPWTEVEGRRDIDILGDAQQAEVVMANDRAVMAAGTAQELEEIVDHPAGGRRIFMSTKVPYDDGDDGIVGLVGLSVDITERRELTKLSMHNARRTAMGDMAAAIAHEINQPLAAIAMILAGTVAVLEQAQYDGLALKSLAMARVQCARGGDIIRRVRSFVSGGDDTKRIENLAVIVDEACSLALVGSRESDVTTAIIHDNDDIAVNVDRVQIEQVIVNLIRNAMDAKGSAKGMILRVTTGYGVDGMALVSVSDSGPGLSGEVAARLFEPFVSTKGVKGMGVGLSICRTIVENHGGRVWAEPDVTTGATFRFTLPMLQPVAA